MSIKVNGTEVISDLRELTNITNLKTVNGNDILGSGDIITHPNSHPPSIIEQDANNRFVTDAEKTNWSAKQDAGNYALNDHIHNAVDDTTPGFMTVADKSKLDQITGINTGDQTDITGNAGTATLLQNPRTINGVVFDGSSDITINAVDSTARIEASKLGIAGGVATLDALGKVTASQLPSYVDDVLEYDQLSSFPSTGSEGTFYISLDTGKVYRWTGEDYTHITSVSVDSVNNKTGVVVLDKNDIGLENVDNTSDLDKPVSTAQKIAIEASVSSHVDSGADAHAVATTSTHGFMSSVDKEKLDGIDTTTLLNRSNHTGTQDINTVVGLQDALNNKASSDHTHNDVSVSSSGFMSATDKVKLDNISEGANNYVHPETHQASIISQDSNNRFVTDAEKAAWSAKQPAGNYATLDELGKVPSTQLPSYVDDVLEFVNLAEFPTAGESAKIYVALDTNKTYRWSGSTYVYITSGAVDSVAGKNGVVTLADMGLDSIDNTSDLDKPVSTAQATAIATAKSEAATDATTKANAAQDNAIAASAPVSHVGSTGTSHGVATTTDAGFMAAVDKGKLDGIQSGATFNSTDAQLRDRSTHTGTQAINTVDGLQIALDGKAESGHTHDVATTAVSGLMSNTDKNKLDGIATGATSNSTDAALRDRSSHTGSQAITTVTGLQTALNGKADSVHGHNDATTTVAGFMSGTDKTKLDGIASGANAYVHPANHPASIIVQDASNRFVTDAEKAAWNAKQPAGTYATGTGTATGTNTGDQTNIIGNAGTATALQTARSINGTSFNGTADITTPIWGKTRTFTLGNTGKSVDGSGNVGWSLSEIGAQSENQYLNGISNHTGSSGFLKKTLQNKWEVVKTPYDISYFVNGKPLSSEIVIKTLITREVIYDQNMPGSLAKCTTAPSSTVVFEIIKDTVVVGYITFNTGTLIGVFSTSISITFSVGNLLVIRAPATQDATFSDPVFTIKGDVL